MTKDLWQRTSIYSLRKFKGVGLASAIVGTMVFSAGLSPVMAAETDEGGSSAVANPTDGHTAPNESGRIVIANETNPVTKPTTETTNMGGGTTGTPTENTSGATTSTERAAVEPNPIVTERNSNPVAVADDTTTDSHVSEKAKEVVRELNDTLVMKKEDTASTSDTLFKLDEGLKVTEEEKAYVKAVTDAFNDMPELVRSGVHSLTFVRKPNGNYGYTYSESGDVNMNMQYYHPELTHGEPGSLQQSVEVLGHEVGHIFNAKSFRDNKEWSFSRDPKYAELAKEVYGDSMTDNIHGRWASDFGSYVAWVSGKKTPQNDGERKIYAYMDSLFKGILTPREDRITPELKQAVEAAKAGGKHLVYDGHVSLDATYKDVDNVQAHVDELNRAEVAKVAGISDAGHFKTYGINKLVTTRYLSDGVEIAENVLSKQDAGQFDRPGYEFVNKETTHDGLLVEYHYNAKNTYALSNETLDADLDVQKSKSYVSSANKANLRFTLKKDVPNLVIEYRLQNLTTGNYQISWRGNNDQASQSNPRPLIASTPLNGQRKGDLDPHRVGNLTAGYTASADLKYYIHNGADGDNTYRLTAILKDGDTEIGRVSKDFIGEVINHNKGDMSNVKFLSQAVQNGENLGGIIKNDKLYKPVSLLIAENTEASKLKNTALSERKKALNPNDNQWDSVSRQTFIRYTVYNDDYRLALPNNKRFENLKDAGDRKIYPERGAVSKEDDKGIISATRSATTSAFQDTALGLMYVGNDKTPRTDHVKVKVEWVDTASGEEKVIEEKVVTGDFKFVNYSEDLKPNFADRFQIDSVSAIGKSIKRGEAYQIENEALYGTKLYNRMMWKFDGYWDNIENGIARYNMNNISDDKHVFLENMVGVNVKKPTDALFSDVDYTLHFDMAERADGNKLDFNEVIFESRVNRDINILDAKDYKETAYWVDAAGQRHELGSKVSDNKVFQTLYTIPKEAKSVEIDVVGKVPINYGPYYWMRYVTTESYKQLKNENRYLRSDEADVFDNRAYTFKAKLVDKLSGEERNLDTKSVVKDAKSLYLRTDSRANEFNENSVNYNEVLNIKNIQFSRENGSSLNSETGTNISPLIDETYPMSRVLVLEKDVQVAESGWEKRSTFQFGDKELTVYTKPYTGSRDLNQSGTDINVMVKPTEANLMSSKQYVTYTGLLFKQKADMPELALGSDNTRPMFEWSANNERLDRKVMSELGIDSWNRNSGDNVRLTSARQFLTTSRSLEFKASQTIEESNVLTKTHYDTAGKTLDIKVDVVNNSQTTSKKLEVIQKLPVGTLEYSFTGVNEHPDYTVYYTSDSEPTSTSSWSEEKPSNITGIKWVRKTALETNKLDSVGYKITVASDKDVVKKSIAGGSIVNNGLRGNINDVSLYNHQDEVHVRVIRRDVTEDGLVTYSEELTNKRLLKGVVSKVKDIVPEWLLNDYQNQTAWNMTGDVVVAKYDIREASWTPVKDDNIIYFDRTIPNPRFEDARRNYKAKWSDGYVEPDTRDLANLFGGMRSYTYLPNESNQKLKVFEISYTNGSKGKGYVDISIDPVKEPVTEIHKGITYQGDEEKDLGYKETTPGNNHTYTKVKSYTADDSGIFHESVTTENDVPAKDAIVTLGTKPTVKTENTPKGKRYEADPDQSVKGQETIAVPGQDGVKTSTTRYTVNPTTGDITSNTTVENTEKVDMVVKVGNKEVITEPVSMVTRYKAEPGLEKDVHETETTGRAGSREITVTYDVNAVDGTLSNPTRESRDAESMTPTVIKVGSVHKDVVETEITTKYVSDDTKVRDSREELVAGSKGVKTTTTTYEVDENTGATHSPTTQVDDQPMVQRVVKIGTKPTVDIESIAITTRYIFDENLAYGQQIVEEKGSEGRVVTTTTYTMNESDGTTSADTPDVQTTPMVQRVIRIGVKPTVEETPINFNTFYEPDPTADKDSRVDKVAGKVGKVTTTTTYTYDSNTGVVTPNPSTSQKEDAVDRIVKVGTRPNVVETPIKFTTTYEADPESQRDSKVDKVVGKNGTTTVTTTYSVDPKTGVVTENPSVTTTKDPVNAVIKVGTKSTEVVETLPSPKRFVKDPTRPKDEEPLTEHGETGSKTTITTYSLNPITGVTAESARHWMVVGPTDTIVRVPAGDKVVEEKIAITTRYIEDPTKDFGYEEEISKGSEGKIVTTTTYNVDGQTGDVTEGGTNQVRTDMVQRVVRKGTKPKVVETPIHFTTRYEKDGTKPKGENTDFVNGVPGKTITTTTYTLDPDTGKVTENPSTSTTEEPVTKVVKVGAKDTIEVTPIELVTRYERDDDLMVGKSTIVNAGKAGSITTTTTYDVNPTTGDVIESGKTSITDDMVEKVVKVGTKPSVLVDTHPINVRYVPKEDIDYGVRTVKSEGSSTVITSTTNYVLNPDGSTTASTPVVTTVDGSDRVIEVGVKTSSVTIELPYDVETKYDSNLEAGQTVVDQNGENGSKTIVTTYSLNETTGDVTSNTNETSVQPKPKKVRIGTGVRSTNVRHIIHNIQFETETIVDRFLPKGKEVVENEGTLGKDIETIVEQLFNGEVRTSDSSTQRVLDPVKRVVRIGIYEFAKPIENLTIEPEEFNGGVNPNDAPVVEIPEFNGGVTPNDAPTYDKPEFNGGVNPNDAPVVEIPEFNGGVTPNEAPTYDKPEFNGGVNPNDAPVVEIPEFNGGVTPNEAPTYDKPEFNGGVNPNDAPVVEIPEFNGGVTPNEAPVVEIPTTTPNEVSVVETPATTANARQLPNTGESGNSLVSVAIGTIIGLLGLGLARKRED